MIDKETLQKKIDEAQQEKHQLVANINMMEGVIRAYQNLINEMEVDDKEEDEKEK